MNLWLSRQEKGGKLKSWKSLDRTLFFYFLFFCSFISSLFTFFLLASLSNALTPCLLFFLFHFHTARSSGFCHLFLSFVSVICFLHWFPSFAPVICSCHLLLLFDPDICPCHLLLQFAPVICSSHLLLSFAYLENLETQWLEVLRYLVG